MTAPLPDTPPVGAPSAAGRPATAPLSPDQTEVPLPPRHVARPYDPPLFPAQPLHFDTPDGARIEAYRYAPAADAAVTLNAAVPPRYPVLMLHGNGEEHGIFGALITAVVACGREVVAVDSRAQGRSTRGTAPLAYELMTEDAVRVLDAAGVARAHVLGFSDGAIEGLLMARDYPERVASLTAVGANLSPDGLPGNDEFEEVSRAYAAWAAYLQSAQPEQATESARSGQPTRATQPTPSGHSAQPGTAAATYEDGTPAPTREQAAWTAELLHLMVVEPHIDPHSLVRIACPACIMSGALDEIPQTETARIAAAIPGAEHTLPKVAPEAVLRELLVTIAAAE